MRWMTLHRGSKPLRTYVRVGGTANTARPPLPQHLPRRRWLLLVMPSQSITLDEAAYQYVLETKTESVSQRVRELVAKGIEQERGESE